MSRIALFLFISLATSGILGLHIDEVADPKPKKQKKDVAVADPKLKKQIKKIVDTKPKKLREQIDEVADPKPKKQRENGADQQSPRWRERRPKPQDGKLVRDMTEKTASVDGKLVRDMTERKGRDTRAPKGIVDRDLTTQRIPSRNIPSLSTVIETQRDMTQKTSEMRGAVIAKEERDQRQPEAATSSNSRLLLPALIMVGIFVLLCLGIWRFIWPRVLAKAHERGFLRDHMAEMSSTNISSSASTTTLSSSTTRCLKTRMERFERRVQEHHEDMRRQEQKLAQRGEDASTFTEEFEKPKDKGKDWEGESERAVDKREQNVLKPERFMSSN